VKGYSAKQETVLIVSSKTTGPYAIVINEIRQKVNNPNIQLRVIAADAFSKSQMTVSGQRVRLVVTIGTSAARQVQQQDVPVPVLNTLIPRETYNLIHGISGAQSAHSSKHSAIYIDQPFSRQIRLVRVALPKFKRVGIILGPHSKKLKKDVQHAGRLGGASLFIEEVDSEKELVSSLSKLLDSVDIVLAIPDKAVFNRRTARNLLLISYRQKVPLMGYSKAYVNAGALLAVYSTPRELGQHIAETILMTATARQWKLPPAQFPRYYSVAVNERVARSLGIYIDNVKMLKKKLGPGR
jgi:ABC-type uncharacterized transport system substrate-binding protein